MRIVYIAGSKIPSRTANSIHVMKMCQAFQQEGYETTLFVPQPDGETADLSSIWYHYGISTPFSLEYIARRGYLNVYLQAHDFAFRAVWRARREGASLIYTRASLSAFWASLTGLPTIYELHQPIPEGKSRLKFWTIIRGRGFRRLVAITRALKHICLEEFARVLSSEQIIVAPDGVDMERFADLPGPGVARKRLAIPPSRLVAGYAGHLYPGRGVEIIIELAQRLPTVQFLLVGGTEEAIDARRKQVQALGLANINLIGFVPNSELPEYLAACDVLLMPYQRQVAVSQLGGGDTARVMSPMKMFEYMATGRLIISSNLPVLCEVLNESNAVLCGPKDVDAWQRTIERAIEDQEWRNRIGEQARNDAYQYTWRRRVQRVLSGVELKR